MSRKLAASDPVLAIDFFLSGFYTHRSQLFAPFKNIGINVVSFHDPVIDGNNMEDTDLYEWQRRAGFSIFCSVPLPDSEIVNQFYSSRNLNGTVLPFVDTTQRLCTFSPTTLTTIINKTTSGQGYISTLGNITYFSDGASVDLSKWDGTRLSSWGLAAPTVVPADISAALGFWQPFTTFHIGNSILDPNGNIESVSSILIPNGSFNSPSTAQNLAFGGSLAANWGFDSVNGGYALVDGYRHIQQNGGYSATSSVAVTLPLSVVVGNRLIVNFTVNSVNFIPSVISVSDNLGNVFTQQANTTHLFAGGGGNNYYFTNWVYSAPISVGGASTVTVQLNANGPRLSVHEVNGISNTITTSATGGADNVNPFNTGTVIFAGTQLVMSLLGDTSLNVGSSAPSGYIDGVTAGPSAPQLHDAYLATTSPQSPTWSLFSSADDLVGITSVWPITTLATGYTQYLFLRDFNLAVPSTATITGIVVTIPKFNASGAGTISDQSVKLVIGGAVAGTDHASATAWNNSGYAVTTYGTPTDTWGLTGGQLNPANFNTNGAAGFGVALSANISAIVGGSAIPEVGFNSPNQPIVTIYFQSASGLTGPGVSGGNQPMWPTAVNSTVTDGGLTWTNYGPVQAWFPTTGYPTPIIITDPNGNLQLSTRLTSNAVPAWSASTGYTLGNVVYFGGQYWISVVNGTNTGNVPSVIATTTSAGITTPYWALTTTPLVTGLIAPVWNTTVGGITVDGSYKWQNIGQGTPLATIGHAYVFGYRTIYGHLTTCSPFSMNTGAILGPLNASITSFSISSNVVTFNGNNNFVSGNVFEVQGLLNGLYLNNQSYTVLTASPSAAFLLTSVQVAANVLTIQALNNLVAGQTVTFSGVQSAIFLNGQTVTVLAGGLSGTQFTASFTHSNYGPTSDTGNVNLNGFFTANFTHADVSLTADAGAALPLLASVSGIGTGSTLCNSVATITAVSITANIVTVTASNNFQPGIWVTFAGLSGALFLNGQQLQVISVDQPVGTQNTQFQVIFQTANYTRTADTGTVTFNAIEVYRTSDGGGLYLFAGAVTNPGAGLVWKFNDFVVDANLDEALIAPLGHLNDPPPGTPGSQVLKTGTITRYWQGRLWMVVGNFVYFSAGPDCTNGIPEEAWPPANRFQYAGPVLGLMPTADGGGLLVYLADRVAVILGGPETISFYSMDALSNFGISNPNALFKDGSVIGQFTTQQQYINLLSVEKQDIGEHIGDYLASNFTAAKTYLTVHRNGLDVGAFLSNGVDRIVRYGSNINAWSVPAFPAFGAGALASIETSVGTYSLMAASPTGGTSVTTALINPNTGTDIAGSGTAWTNPSNITLGSPTQYATVIMSVAGGSHILRAAYPIPSSIPSTAIIQGITVAVTGKQTDVSGALTLTITPTGGVLGVAETHTFQFGTSNTTVNFGSTTDLWGMPWNIPANLAQTASNPLSFDITSVFTGSTSQTMSVAEVQITISYQNPGNYLYARDLNSWGDGGQFGNNNGLPYGLCNITLGNITLSPLGGPAFPLQHVVGYFNAVGILNNGTSSQPDIWILPNEVSATTGGPGFIQLPDALNEPPEGQTFPSATILALRYPLNSMNSYLASQFIHHLQVKIQFEPENAPNTIKAIAFKENQD